MKSGELKKFFLKFFEKNEHKIVPSSSLLPSDYSVLFTTAGMQQFKPYYLGERSPYGKNVASCQKCIRTSDIQEVGDERHLTFFEMLGNFSFGGYFKSEAIRLSYEFLVNQLNLDIDYVTIFSPEKLPSQDWRKGISADKQSYDIWRRYIPEKKIKWKGSDNFWGPTGQDGPCGSTTEIYVNGIEIWNIVFNEFFCDENKNLENLPVVGVDTGMGLERLAMTVQKKENIFQTDLFEPLIKLIPLNLEERKKRIIADHVRAISFLIFEGIKPANKDRGYVLRRLIRRIAAFETIDDVIIPFDKMLLNLKIQYPELKEDILAEFNSEIKKFKEALKEGIKEFFAIYKRIKEKKGNILSGKEAFYLYQTFGLTPEIIKEICRNNNLNFNEFEFEKEYKEHQKISNTVSAGMFKGGLVDREPKTIKLHTAHHLLLAALQQVLGQGVRQRGSNINQERLRIDFSFDRKLTEEEKIKIEKIVNEKIKSGLKVIKREMDIDKAKDIGAQMEFGVKYGDRVSVYFIEDEKGNIFSKEFCGGPHVDNTSELGRFKIIKEEGVSRGIRRIKAVLE